VAAGEAVFLGPGVARRVLAYFAGSTQRVADPLPGLTEREREILDLMATGWGNQNIARRLQIAPKTVRNHVSNVIGKLQVASRGEAIVRARSLGYGQPDR
jgi:DNA-binding NarL/FixJ family response regulator